jgi:hypothetical protein
MIDQSAFPVGVLSALRSFDCYFRIADDTEISRASLGSFAVNLVLSLEAWSRRLKDSFKPY